MTTTAPLAQPTSIPAPDRRPTPDRPAPEPARSFDTLLERHSAPPGHPEPGDRRIGDRRVDRPRDDASSSQAVNPGEDGDRDRTEGVDDGPTSSDETATPTGSPDVADPVDPGTMMPVVMPVATAAPITATSAGRTPASPSPAPEPLDPALTEAGTVAAPRPAATDGDERASIRPSETAAVVPTEAVEGGADDLVGGATEAGADGSRAALPTDTPVAPPPSHPTGEEAATAELAAGATDTTIDDTAPPTTDVTESPRNEDGAAASSAASGPSEPDVALPGATTSPPRAARSSEATTTRPAAAITEHLPAEGAARSLLARAELHRTAGRPLDVDITTTDLGRVRVTAADGADGLQLQLSSDRPDGRARLVEHLQELRHDLDERGVGVGSLDVASGHARSDADHGRAEERPTPAATVGTPDPVAATPTVGRLVPLHVDGLDLRL